MSSLVQGCGGVGGQLSWMYFSGSSGICTPLLAGSVSCFWKTDCNRHLMGYKAGRDRDSFKSLSLFILKIGSSCILLCFIIFNKTQQKAWLNHYWNNWILILPDLPTHRNSCCLSAFLVSWLLDEFCLAPQCSTTMSAHFAASLSNLDSWESALYRVVSVVSQCLSEADL